MKKEDLIKLFCDKYTFFKEGEELYINQFKKIIDKIIQNQFRKNFKYTHNPKLLEDFGYETKRIKVCGYCEKKTTGYRKKGNYCCDNYNNKNRKNKTIIINIQLTKEVIQS